MAPRESINAPSSGLTYGFWRRTRSELSNAGWPKNSESVSLYLPSKNRRWFSLISKLIMVLTLLRSKPGCRSATAFRSAKSQSTHEVLLTTVPL
ncbi:hypothetical protein CFBP7900_16180 [Xanthomonas hortorum pv. carotae]|uniref:Uncharacterized protein n=1 Tax=Xanthomonas hortorum pv. carotae TaxID=487904 RepID=A0A6V7D0U7_9XANT|nr:hypothetical protein CFBP7900_16180 [Xanthomonas hortorum pv. carotae]CAD0325561.1 hypothetical protein CFBP7900_16180 [Xanthomonas hortorum pv. carotae]